MNTTTTFCKYCFPCFRSLVGFYEIDSFRNTIDNHQLEMTKINATYIKFINKESILSRAHELTILCLTYRIEINIFGKVQCMSCSLFGAPVLKSTFLKSSKAYFDTKQTFDTNTVPLKFKGMNGGF